ncbi:MAG: class I SAM-dependent methyltransferase [Sphingomonadales bacterium]|nr:class I SAM-dependent methyltransferase [Sphingomonadales bacterium]
MTGDQRDFTPAAGHGGALARYDEGVRAYTREAEWRPLMVARIDPQPGQLIVDIGAGTGTLAVALAQRCPGARIVACDPDPAPLAIAHARAEAAGAAIEWRQGFAGDEDWPAGTVDHATCSLVLHQVPTGEKRRLIQAMGRWTAGRGTIHIADYARQRGTMRQRFRATVQAGDGIEDTQPNADGMLELIFAELKFRRIGRDRHFRTRSGRFSLFSRQALS